MESPTQVSRLAVRDLGVHFPSPAGPVRAVDGVSFDLGAGEALAIVGETGSGKTSIARALLGLHPDGCARGSIRLAGEELMGRIESGWRAVRGRRIALAVQNASTAFDPVHRISDQIIEPMREHLRLPEAEARARAERLAAQVGLEPVHLRSYPHQLSDGQKRRALLAMALSCDPEVLIVDEPTSGQDVLSRASLVDLLCRLRAESGMSLLIISHDLAAASRLAEWVAVMYAGKFVEVGASSDVLETPRHPYAWGLLNAYPNMTTTRDLRGIRGQMPDPARPPAGCRFHPRCTQTVDRCREAEPPLTAINGRLIACHLGGLQTLLAARDLSKAFSLDGPRSPKVQAVRRVSLDVYEGEVVAVVGQTASGKTTLARLLVGLVQSDGGRVELEGQDLSALNGDALKRLRQRIQLVAQDPFESLSPRLTLAEIVREPLDVQGLGTLAEREAQVRETVAAVGLPATAEFLARRTHELSGGQLQRIAIARALVLNPKLIVADEPVSMLDASEQAKVINLLKDLQNARGMGLLLISHDLALVRKVADRIVVLRQGEVVESGPAHRVISRPQHEHTQTLLRAAPAFSE